MAMWVSALVLLMSSTLLMGQRPFYAGLKPIGYPDTPDRTTESLVDRFGEGSTERLPIEANGDRDLIDRLSKLPVDKQPFWFLNWQALEAHRQNPQTYPQKPSDFLDPFPNTSNNLPNRNSVVNRSGEDSNSVINPVSGDSNLDRKPVSEDSNLENKPINEDSNSDRKPVSGDSNLDRKPVSGDSNLDRKPVSGDSNLDRKPVSGDSNLDRRPVTRITPEINSTPIVTIMTQKF